jgi:hypothetical protein
VAFFKNIQDYNFAFGSLWVRNLVSGIKGGIYSECVREQCAEENIWTKEIRSDRRLEKAA